MNRTMSSGGSFGGVVGPVDCSWATAAARPQQKRWRRYERPSSSSASSSTVGGLNEIRAIDGEEERGPENPTQLRQEQRVLEAVLVRQRRPPQFPTLAREHKAELAELRRRHRDEVEFLVRGGGPLLVEADLLRRRHQDEEKEQRARHVGELLEKRAQSIRDAEIAIRGGHEAQAQERDPRERPINRVPVIKSKRPARDQDREEICTICLDDVYDESANGGGVRTLDCRHKYHKSCINKWLDKKNVCPLCKRRAV